MLPWRPTGAFSSDTNTSMPGDAGANQTYHYMPQGGVQSSYQQQHQMSPLNAQPLSPSQGSPQGQQPPQLQESIAGPAPPPPITLASVLHFLQTEHRRYARDRNEWEIERAEMRARIALLEGEKRGSDAALRDLGRRCKMLENALRGERSKFLSGAAAGLPQGGAASSASGTSSPMTNQQLQSGAPSKPSKDAKDTLNSTSESVSASQASESVPMVQSASSQQPSTGASAAPGAPAAPAHAQNPALAAGSRVNSSLGLNPNGTGPSLNLLAGRDPRGRARSRDYLKQCLQEITYLTSSTTMNPLAPSSYSAPNVPRPRKVLPEFTIPPNSQGGSQPQPGIINIAPPPAPAPPYPLAPSYSGSEGSTSAPISVTTSDTQSISTAFPSDPPSAFVPLKRVFSPGITVNNLPLSSPPAVSSPLAAAESDPAPSPPTTSAPLPLLLNNSGNDTKAPLTNSGVDSETPQEAETNPVEQSLSAQESATSDNPLES